MKCYLHQVLSAVVILLAVISVSAFAANAGSPEPVALYVGTDGEDGNPGTAEAPLASLTGARDTIRKLKAAEGLPEGGITVWIGDGEYVFSECLVLTKEDSGTGDAPIQYGAIHPGTVRLSGGKHLPAEAFQTLTSDSTGRIQKEVLDKIQVVDLKALGVEDYGQFPDAFRRAQAVPELFFNDKRMTLAQWPDEGWAEIEKVVESGPAPWRNHESDALGVFEYAGDRPSRWEKAKDVWLEGYWCFDWACETIRVGAIDVENRQITLSQKHGYGIGSGNPAPRRYRAMNLLEELDVPGEYYLDREAGKLYFYPPGPLAESRMVLSLLSDPLIAAEDLAHVSFAGLTLETTTGNGMNIKNSEAIQLTGSTIRNTGLDGVLVEEGTAMRIESCDLYDIGTCGVIIGGGDRKTLTPSQHSVVNNHIHHVSRRMRTHGYNIQLSGVGIHMAHNLIEDATHQAIGLAGNDHIIEYNEVNRVGMASDDCGAFYMGRNPSERGNIIRYNYWHHIGSEFNHGSCAVYFDDGTGGQVVHGNVFYKASGGSFGAVFIHGGHDNVVTNNLFIECERAVGAAPWDAKRWKEWMDGDLWKTRLHEEVAITEAPYTERYPGLTGFMDSHKTLRLNHVKNNLAVKCGSFASGNWDIEQCITVNHDPGFVNRSKGDFNLRQDAAVLTQLPDFEKIPFDKMGLYTDKYRTMRN